MAGSVASGSRSRWTAAAIAPGCCAIVGQHGTRAGGGEHLAVEELIGPLRQQQLRQPGGEGAEHRARPAVVDREVDPREHRGLGDKPFHVDVRWQLAQQFGVPVGADGDQDVDVQRAEVVECPLEHLDRTERHRAEGEVDPRPGAGRHEPVGNGGVSGVVGDGPQRKLSERRSGQHGIQRGRGRVDQHPRQCVPAGRRRQSPVRPDATQVTDRRVMDLGREVVRQRDRERRGRNAQHGRGDAGPDVHRLEDHEIGWCVGDLVDQRSAHPVRGGVGEERDR